MPGKLEANVHEGGEYPFAFDRTLCNRRLERMTDGVLHRLKLILRPKAARLSCQGFAHTDQYSRWVSFSPPSPLN